jgi:hypothetical protein
MHCHGYQYATPVVFVHGWIDIIGRGQYPALIGQQKLHPQVVIGIGNGNVKYYAPPKLLKVLFILSTFELNELRQIK